MIKNTHERLRELNSRPIEQKIEESHALIKQALEKGKAAVAWSGGKDSTVLLHMARQYDPDIVVVWNNTGVEFPETYGFIRQLKEEWSLNLIIAKPAPGISFWWCVERHGWPLLGKEVRGTEGMGTRGGTFPKLTKRKRKAAQVARISSYCCDYLKERPMGRVCREQKIQVELIGCLVIESRQRLLNWFRLGDFYQRKKDQMWIAWPMAGWTDEDVWEYHDRFSLPHCRLYDMGHRRNGCWPCGMDIGFEGNHLSRLRQTHPKLWHHIIVDRGLGKELLKIKLALRDGQADMFSNKNIESLLEQRPCYFDNLEGL